MSASRSSALIEPITETLHGITIVDPYRWLEEQDASRTRGWLAEQTAYTRGYFAAIPNRALLRKRVEVLLSSLKAYRDPRKAGDRCFFLKREAHQEQPVLAMREGDSGDDIVLLDPVEMTGSSQGALDILATSPKGKFLALASRTGGEDCAPIRFLDVDQRQVLSDQLAAGLCGGLVLSEDRGVYYIHSELKSPPPHLHAVLWHAFGTSFGDDAQIFSLDKSTNRRLSIATTCGPELLLYQAATPQQPVLSDFYLHDLKTGGAARILRDIEGIFCPFFVASQLFAFTDVQAPNRRIVAIDVDNATPARWRTIVPEGLCPIVQFAVAGDSLCLVYLENLAHKVLIFDVNGNMRRELLTPTEGSVQFCQQQGATDTLFYQFSSFAQPPVICSYRHGAEVRELGASSPGSDQSASINVRRIRYPAKDGTPIPMFLVSKKGFEARGPRPVFLTAYGGFGTSLTPRFTAYATILMELGCIFAVANIRGGAEFGREWHEAAKRHKRQTAIDDFLSAAEWLLSSRIAEPGRIAIGGGSNAGLLVGAALTQRPELFRAVLCLGPLLDMLRYHKFDLASYWIDEFGSADIPDDFHALYGYSPYHRIHDDVAYPAVLFISGDADTRCNPMHARKMAARLQAASASGHPILLDYKPAWGHIPVQPLSVRIEALTDRLSFLCKELDLKIPEAWS